MWLPAGADSSYDICQEASAAWSDDATSAIADAWAAPADSADVIHIELIREIDFAERRGDGANGAPRGREHERLLFGVLPASRADVFDTTPMHGIGTRRPQHSDLPGHTQQAGVPSLARDVDDRYLATASTWSPHRNAGSCGTAPTSRGAVGHPDLCLRPCLFAASGTCNNGSACDFCHLPHKQPLRKIERWHKEMLISMPRQQAVAFVLPMLHKKLRGLTCWRDVLPAFAVFCRACGSHGCPAPCPPNYSEHQLVKVLESMNLRRLLTTLQRTVFRDDAAVQAAVEPLVRAALAAVSMT
mmetsp:Transcript_110709/g.319793  ORF Transcript_110709/g.319793 Transcript_110709/m.319793 type:complete len:300 (+) Transcript_110709:68-967(+)